MFYVLPEIVFGCVALSVNLSYKFLMPYLVHMVPVLHVAHMIHVVYFACLVHIVLNLVLPNVLFL